MDEHEVRTTALRQLGLVTRAQVLAAGGSDRGIAHRVATGRWERLRRGVFVVGAAPSSWEQTALGATLAAGPDTALCIRSAARGLGLVERSGAMQLAVLDRRRVRLPGVEVHRPVALDRTELSSVGPVPVTSAIRTLIDLAPSQPAPTMGALLDTAIRDHRATPDAVARRIVELAARGRPSPSSLIEALALRCEGYDPGRSALESRIIAALLAHGLPEPVRQHPIVRGDGRRAHLDLAYPDVRLAIEVDGWAFHAGRGAFDADRVRANELVLLGWTVLRFTSAMTDEQICSTVARALGL